MNDSSHYADVAGKLRNIPQLRELINMSLNYITYLSNKDNEYVEKLINFLSCFLFVFYCFFAVFLIVLKQKKTCFILKKHLF